MSFLARPIRPLVCRVLAARSFTTSRSVLTSGYGRSAAGAKNGQTSVDPVSGGEVPEYSGPSIKEKQKGSAVHTENKATEMKQKMKSEDAAQRQGNKVAGGQLKDVRAKRPYSTSAFRSAPPTQLSEDAARLASKAQTKATKMKHSVQDAAAEMKDGAADMFAKAKKTARNIKEKVSDAVEDTTDRLSDVGERAAQKVADVTENSDLMKPTYEEPDASQLRQGNQISGGTLKDVSAKRPFSTTAPRSSKLTEDVKEGAADMFAKAKKTARSIKEKVTEVVEENSPQRLSNDPLREDELPGVRMPLSDETAAKNSAVPSSLLDGPQQMPQGVGRRAKNEKQQPLETGTRGS